MTRYTLHVEHSTSRRQVDVFMLERDERTGAPIAFVQADPDGCASFEVYPGTEPRRLTSLSEDDAQRLFDEMWRQGWRPTGQAVDHAGVVEAQKAHIADLRAQVTYLREQREVVPLHVFVDMASGPDESVEQTHWECSCGRACIALEGEEMRCCGCGKLKIGALSCLGDTLKTHGDG